MTGSHFIVHFPLMHPELTPQEFLSLGLFLNPGLLKAQESYFTPDSLELDQEQALSFLEQCRQYGENFKRPSDIAHMVKLQEEDFYTGSKQSIQYELSTYDHRQKSGEHEKLELLQAQKYLLLNCALEERLMELGRIDNDLSRAWSSFDNSLGFDEDEERFQDMQRQSISPGINTGHWKKLMCAFAAFLPEDGYLLIHDDDLYLELEEYGASWKKQSPDKHSAFFFAEVNLVLYEAVLKTERIGCSSRISRPEIRLLAVTKK